MLLEPLTTGDSMEDFNHWYWRWFSIHHTSLNIKDAKSLYNALTNNALKTTRKPKCKEHQNKE